MFEAWIHNSSIWSLICFFIVYISSLCLNLKIFNLIVFGSICLKPDGFIILLQFSSWTAFQFFIIIEHSSRTALQFFIIIHHSSWTAFHLFIIIQHSSRTALHFFNDISMNGMIIYTSIRNINPPFVYIILNKIFVYTAKLSFFSHAIHICSQSKTIGITGLYILNKTWLYTVKFSFFSPLITVENNWHHWTLYTQQKHLYTVKFCDGHQSSIHTCIFLSSSTLFLFT